MDRFAPTRRPPGKNAGTQLWRELLFLHWWVPVDALRPLVPARLGLDLWEGRALVGLVPFRMEHVRPSWLPDVLSQDFLETNLRTYVHLDGDAPGVYFFSLEASSWLAVQAARAGWGLPYHYADMAMSETADERGYTSVRRSDPAARLDVRCRVGAPLGPSAPGTLEEFLLERYYLYVERDGVLSRGQVHHTPYPTVAAEARHCEEGLVAAAGLPAPNRPPDLVHASPGVDVEVFALGRV
ncbi:MAG: DUF2071 domain-containing protein [Pseudomonadota bacterium]|nr:DUF2071 domain-containing protein [Pseudomonadota bacterium]